MENCSLGWKPFTLYLLRAEEKERVGIMEGRERSMRPSGTVLMDQALLGRQRSREASLWLLLLYPVLPRHNIS